MSISGSLAKASLQAVLESLYQEARSGTLRVASAGAVAAVLFCNGRIIGASRPHMRRLGELLTEAGVIDERLLSLALRRQRDERPRLPLGRILVAIGATTDKAVRVAIEIQVQETVAELLGWKTGSYEFIEHEIKPVDSIAFAPGEVYPRAAVDTPGEVSEAALALDDRLGGADSGAAAQPAAPAVSAMAPSAPAAKPETDPAIMRAKDWARSTGRMAAVSAPREGPAVSEAIRGIGFYDSVQREGRSLHVQTEVIGRREAVVRSTVLEGGTVHYAERKPYPVEIVDVEQARKHVEEQHKRVVARASRGELESR